MSFSYRSRGFWSPPPHWWGCQRVPAPLALPSRAEPTLASRCHESSQYRWVGKTLFLLQKPDQILHHGAERPLLRSPLRQLNSHWGCCQFYHWLCYIKWLLNCTKKTGESANMDSRCQRFCCWCSEIKTGDRLCRACYWLSWVNDQILALNQDWRVWCLD